MNINKKRTFIHVHIPKTAGSSFNDVFSRNFSPYSMYSHHEDAHILSFHKIPFSERSRFEAIFGHIDFSFHRYIPNFPIYLFILREPKQRVFSYYRYLYERTDHPDYKLVGAKELSFDAFIELSRVNKAIRSGIDNVQTRMVAGVGIGSYMHSHKELISLAISNILKNTVTFGFTERYDDFLSLCTSKYGWVLENRNLNTTTKTSSSNKENNVLSDDNRLLLNEYTLCDGELYSYCQEVYDKQRK
jgi:hypothetical protein